MSLINDALRRANQTRKQPPAQPSSGAPMRPVEQSPERKSPLLPIILTVVLAIGLGIAGWFFWMSSRVESKSLAATKLEITSAKKVLKETPAHENVAPPIAPSVETKITPSSEPAIALQPEPVSATQPATIVQKSEAPVTPVVAAVPTTPALKLQGIFYRASDPTALINGMTVGIGESVSDARVLSITPQQVTLEWNTQKIVLNFRRP